MGIDGITVHQGDVLDNLMSMSDNAQVDMVVNVAKAILGIWQRQISLKVGIAWWI